ncbi:hypothetical protein PMIN02_001989 [Paraphaeosphaeria minitans]
MHLTTLTLFALGSCCSYHDSCYERATYDGMKDSALGRFLWCNGRAVDCSHHIP